MCRSVPCRTADALASAGLFVVGLAPAAQAAFGSGSLRSRNMHQPNVHV